MTGPEKPFDFTELTPEQIRDLRAPTYPPLLLQDILEKRIAPDGTIDIGYHQDNPLVLLPLRIDLGYPYGGSFFDELYKFRDLDGNVTKAAIFLGAGACKCMIVIDGEGKFALGDEFHKIEYSPNEDGYVGQLGGERYALDALGRAYLDLDDADREYRDYEEDKTRTPYEPIYSSSKELSPLDKAVRSILEAHHIQTIRQ